MGETLADLGEWELIRRLGAFAPPGQFSDDAALLPLLRDGALVINTDVLVEGIHFSVTTTEPADVAGGRLPPISPIWRRWAPQRWWGSQLDWWHRPTPNGGGWRACTVA
jgi:hypothetical protein